ncbi:927_t:CDS:10 [Gigaspora margarita]|uniref:927_t:CDS:1 n=1 Tax=Gigaspora margarita TaxID=4874 RepID=A0ABN7ULR1_GIGMA|nr:927_t:CDS:10 [Gigaspora margarita]
MADNEIQKIEIQFCFAKNDTQFEEKLDCFLSTILKMLANPHEVERKKAINMCNHISKRMTKTVKLPWNSLVELVHSENFMNSILFKNFTIMYLKKAYDCLTEKDKFMHLLTLIKNIELKPCKQKRLLSELVLELSQKLNPNFTDLETLETKEMVYTRYMNAVDYYYVCNFLNAARNIGSSQKESLCQSLKSKLMFYLLKPKLAANTFPSMIHVSFDCLYNPKTNINLQKQGTEFIYWITRMADSSILELVGEVLLFGLLKIIKEIRIEIFDNLMGEQEKNQTLMFKLFYGPLDLPTQNYEKDNENLKVMIIKFQEFNQLDRLDQLGQWTNEKNIHAIINILEESTDKVSYSKFLSQSTINNSKEKTRILYEQNIPFNHKVVTKISSFALRKVYEQYHKAISANSANPLPSCTGTLSLTIWLLCAHTIKEKYLASSQLLNLHNFHQQWWSDRDILLQQNLVIEDDQLEQLLEEFNNNIILDRPTGSRNDSKSSTQRIHSAFELQELRVTNRKCGICQNIGHNSRTCPECA